MAIKYVNKLFIYSQSSKELFLLIKTVKGASPLIKIKCIINRYYVSSSYLTLIKIRRKNEYKNINTYSHDCGGLYRCFSCADTVYLW